MVGRGVGTGRRMRTRLFPDCGTPQQANTSPLGHSTPSLNPTGSLSTTRIDHVVDTSISRSSTPTVDHVIPRSSTPTVDHVSETSILGQDTPILSPVATKRRRGKTVRSAETSRLSGEPKIRVYFRRGRPVGKNGTLFRTTVAPWARQAGSLPHNVPEFKNLNKTYIDAFWQRVEGTFELFQYITPWTVASQSTPTSNVSMEGGSEVHVTPASSDSTSTVTSAPPLNDDDRQTILRWFRGRYVEYRSELCSKFYDKYETDEERMQHIPPGMPEDQWRYLIELWGTEAFKRKRESAKANRSKLKGKHTGGSENYQSKRARIEETTHAPVNEIQFYIETHTSKKRNTFIDDESREAAATMERIEREHTDESGLCSLSSREVVSQVLAPPTRGRELLQGRVTRPPNAPRSSSMELEREVEHVRAENNDLSRRLEETQQEVASLKANINSIIADSVKDALRQLGFGSSTTPSQSQ